MQSVCCSLVRKRDFGLKLRVDLNFYADDITTFWRSLITLLCTGFEDDSQNTEIGKKQTKAKIKISNSTFREDENIKNLRFQRFILLD